MPPLLFLALTSVSVLVCLSHHSALRRHVAPSPIVASEAGATPIDAKVAADILNRIQKSGAEVGIAFRTLDGKLEWFSRADDVFHAASTMKVPVMIELFHQVREGKLKLDDHPRPALRTHDYGEQ
jgi:beta-lactamase class A